MHLFDLQEGEKGIIVKIKGTGAFRRRLMEMGFVAGQIVTVIKKAPLKDPVEYNVMGYNVSIRNEEAKHIEISRPEDLSHVFENSGTQSNGSYAAELLKAEEILQKKEINIVLVGNPNAGKTTLFNIASGSRERVGNYGGVTVSAKEGTFYHKGYKFNIIDLPGTYSITAYSPEEIFVRNYIIDKHPDIVVNVLDGSNLERNLYLTTQLIDMDIRVVVALNMYDELQQKKDELDHEKLGKLLGIPFVPTVSSKKKGINELFDKILEVYTGKDKTTRHIHINYGEFTEKAINKIRDVIRIPENYDLINHISSRFLAIKLLEEDNEIVDKIDDCPNKADILLSAEKERAELGKLYKEEHIEDVITKAKYGFIAGALKETLKKGQQKRNTRAAFFDWLFTHRFWGFPIFLFFMWLMFSATFFLGEYPMEWIENGFEWLSGTLSHILPATVLTDLLVNGVISGVGGVLVFLPNILLLFLFISFMEDTGYMSRAVFIMDKIMHKIGLHGKSFIPLIMGFGCNVPAIMATRTIENKNDRLITMLINPFMSCAARLPVYVLFISAFFPNNQGNILFGIYLIGVLIAVIVALIFKRLIPKQEDTPFVMELAPFRVPTARATIRGMWGKGVEYLKKIAGIILIATIIIWGLSNYPVKKDFEKDYSVLATQIASFYAEEITPNMPVAKQDSLLAQKNNALFELELEERAEMQEYSLLGRLGHFIEPAIRPLGFDWKMGIALLSGAPAKEIIVGTMGVLYQSEVDEQANVSLVTKLQQQRYTSGPREGERVFTPLVAFTFMIFVLLYFPCVGTIVVIARESGSWKWGAFAAIYPTIIAWVVAFTIYQTGSYFLY